MTGINLTAAQREALRRIYRHDGLPATPGANSEDAVNVRTGQVLWDAGLVRGVCNDAGRLFELTREGHAYARRAIGEAQR